jgi:hypothetical protein
MERPGYEPVSSTLWRQREEYCARLIQNAWRKHKIVLSKSLTEFTECNKIGEDDNSGDGDKILLSRPSPIPEEDHSLLYPNDRSNSPSASSSHLVNV